MKEIKVTLFIEIPDDATDRDIDDWVDVELAGVNSMKGDNPIVDNDDVVEHYWKHET